MIDIDFLFDFSRTHCIAICAALVPANLLATLQTMLMTAFGRSLSQIQLMAGISTIYALLLALHVYTWFAIGVVMAPTFILTLLSGVCIAINFGAVLYARRQNGFDRSAQLS